MKKWNKEGIYHCKIKNVSKQAAPKIVETTGTKSQEINNFE